MIKKLIKYATPISAFIFLVLFVLLFPLYKYVFDPDSIGYSAITERIVAGEYFKSINGLWSPLSSWLAVPLVKLGVDTIFAFKCINGLVGVLLLMSVSKLISKFNISGSLKAVILYTCIPIFLSYCFYELCADFLLLFFFTLYLIQVCSEDFYENKKRQLFAAIIAVLAYFSKAYFFPFFLLHFSVVNLYHYKYSFLNRKIKTLIQNLILGIGCFLLLSSPWLYALTNKYHFFTYSTTGKYNAYMHLHPGTEYTKLLLSPPYADSYNSWEDPFLPFMQQFSPLSSFTTFVAQIKLLLYNLLHSIPFFIEISIFCLPIISGIIFLWFLKKANISKRNNIFICCITALLLPMGYLLFHLETRFIWMLSILCLIMGVFLIIAATKYFQFPQKRKTILIAILTISFLIGPLSSLYTGANSGKSPYVIAEALKQNNIKGKVAANYTNLDQYTELLMSNVIAKNQFYGYSRIDFTSKELLDALKEFDIDYYYFVYSTEKEKEIFLSGDIYKNAIRVFSDIYPRLIVVKLK
ncbi:hypothetical protein ACQ33O_11790 [Ferruginibacter sp. SUN002]|uniref:hypothetical protein n=1 Tax=Ferruginibacter sp. SUN002 TaxID=2937789 RepID=UPI003D36CC98